MTFEDIRAMQEKLTPYLRDLEHELAERLAAAQDIENWDERDEAIQRARQDAEDHPAFRLSVALFNMGALIHI